MATFYTGVDKERYDAGEKFLPQDRFLLNYAAPTTKTEEDQVTESFGIPAAYNTSGSGGTFYSSDQKIRDFNKAIAERQNRLENPGWLQQQVNKFMGGGQRPVSEMGTVQYNPNFTRSYNKDTGLTSFGLPYETVSSDLEAISNAGGAFGQMPLVPTLDEKKGTGIPLGIGTLLSMAPDAYYDKFTVPEQALTQMYMGYTDSNNVGNKDPFGINVRSGFGNYAEYSGEQVTNLNEALKNSAAKRGLTWDAATGSIVGADEEDDAYKDFMSKTKGMQKRLGHYGNVTQNFNALKSNYAAAKKQRDAWEKETYRELEEADKNFTGPHGTGDYDEYSGAGGSLHYDVPASTYTYEGSDEQDKANEGASNAGSSSQTSTAGSSYSRPGASGHPTGHHWADGGRVGLRYGGLLSIL